MAEIAAQAHRPQADDGMRLAAAGGAGHVGAQLHRGVQARDQVGRQEGRVGRHAGDPRAIGGGRGSPVEAGEHAGERAGEAFDAVRDHRQAKGGEAGGIAVGVEDEPAHLRADAPDDPRQDGRAAQRPQALVAAAHAPRLPAGEEEADDGGRGFGHPGLGIKPPMNADERR